MSHQYCTKCGSKQETSHLFCSNCGVSLPSNTSISNKNNLVAFLLCLFLGWFGVHRFYVGRIKSGLLILLMSLPLVFISFFMGFAILTGIFNLLYNNNSTIMLVLFVIMLILFIITKVMVIIDFFTIILSRFKDSKNKKLRW